MNNFIIFLEHDSGAAHLHLSLPFSLQWQVLLLGSIFGGILLFDLLFFFGSILINNNEWNIPAWKTECSQQKIGKRNRPI